MDAVFLQILNMGIAAAWPILAVILLRLFLKKSPGWLTCLLWAVVAVRLICPFFAESAFSLIPSAETLSLSVVRYAEKPVVDSGIPLLDDGFNTALGASFTPNPGASVNPLQVWLSAAGVLWLAGMAVVLCIALSGYLRIRWKVKEAVLGQDGAWFCDNISSPFILGALRPRIYLPSGIIETQIPYILAHEQAHLGRKDHWWKLISCLLLCIYWFHPLVWAAYFLFGRDMELACDEKVIRDYTMEQKKTYAHTMVSCSMQKRMVWSCPLAFGEIGVGKRVEAVLRYRKPAVWAVAAAVLACFAAAACFLTNPPKVQKQESWDERPMLKLGGETYVDSYKPESGLPHGYVLAGTQTAEQAWRVSVKSFRA